MSNLEQKDNEVYRLVKAEEAYQRSTIRLIASENYTSKAVLEACGTVFQNKYSEGYPGARFYQGQVNCDSLENLAIERAKKLFGAEHVNVQPYSGSPANLAVYLAFAKPGDTVLGLNLSHGGHLTHGSKASVTGKWFNAVHYNLDPGTGLIDYAEVRNLALEHKPKILIAGHSAYPRQLDFAKFRSIADEAGAILLVDMAHFAGLVAGGAHPNPVPYADVVTTTTHKT
ncbi:MAG: serine hydroxymethyltransferase, partial [Spirochaetales bacterium]|nr:serine hydroxymethyltransferase [Spirochaetales bacterium]